MPLNSSGLSKVSRGWPEMLDPDDYRAPQALGRALRAAGADGVIFPSVRHAGGECIGAFHPDVVGPCTQGPHLIYTWDGWRVLPDYLVATAQGGGADAAGAATTPPASTDG